MNNAGISNPPKSILKTPVDEYRNVIEVNQIGAYTGIHVVAPTIIAAGGGSIVNISSVNGFVGTWGIAGYVSSKFALRGLTRGAAIELARKGVRVNSIHPARSTRRCCAAGWPEGTDPVVAMAGVVPAGRVGTVDDVAAMVAFLLSDASSYCYGAEFASTAASSGGPRIPGPVKRSRQHPEAASVV